METKMIYIAGPFFNEPQVSLVKDIERVLERTGYEFFSPRTADLNNFNKHPGIDDGQASTIFELDYAMIKKCVVVVAVADFLLRENTELVLRDTKNGMVRAAVKIPDTGTVWEMGAAYALGIPVFMLYVDPSKKLNLMLSQSCAGVIHGLDELELVAHCNFRAGACEGWKGDHR